MGSVLIQRDINLSFPPERLVALMGLSGAGKTTLLKVPARFSAGRC
jgi:ABC-type multidrug transport system ATPase subunit